MSIEIRGTNKWMELCERNQKPKNLLYTTIGYSKAYATCIELFLRSIIIYSDPLNFDVLIICDENMFEDVSHTSYSIFNTEHLKNKLFFLVAPNSDSAMKASMHKLNVFDFPQVHTYNNVVFIDIDVLCLHNVNLFFENMDRHIENLDTKYKECLFAHNERDDPLENRTCWWCMNDYTDEEMEYFKKEHILPFNAGMFAFKYSGAMRDHFKNVIEMIHKSTRVFFFEQAYMNAYFNRKHLVRYDLVSKENYMIFPDLDTLYKDKFVHFCGHPGNGFHKYKIMKEYVTRFDVFNEKHEYGKSVENHNLESSHKFSCHILRNRDKVML